MAGGTGEGAALLDQIRGRDDGGGHGGAASRRGFYGYIDRGDLPGVGGGPVALPQVGRRLVGEVRVVEVDEGDGDLTVLVLCRLVLRLTGSLPFACLAGFLLFGQPLLTLLLLCQRLLLALLLLRLLLLLLLLILLLLFLFLFLFLGF